MHSVTQERVRKRENGDTKLELGQLNNDSPLFVLFPYITFSDTNIHLKIEEIPTFVVLRLFITELCRIEFLNSKDRKKEDNFEYIPGVSKKVPPFDWK